MTRSESQSTATLSPTIGEIFRTYGPAYREKYAKKMHPEQLQAMAAIERCRTAEAGSTIFRCASCGGYHSSPQSCGNRHCPTCQGANARRWLDAQLEKLLPCVYFMMTFTVPASIRRFIRSHPKECYRALLVSAKHAIVTLAKNPKYVGSANVGITGVLHTWGRSLSYHPHTHWIVPGGAISQDGNEWLPSRVDFFVPIYAASKIYRAKFAEEMKRCGLLAKIPAKVWKQRWNVNCKAVGDGRSALGYLAPYVFRVAIGNRRIIKVEPGPDGKGLVTFTYRKTGSNRLRSLPVTAEEFIRRFLQHVLPRGLQKVRHYGFAHPRSKTNWEQLSMMVTVTLNLVYVITVQAKPERLRATLKCPDCGGELRFFDRKPSEQERQRSLMGGITSEFAKDFEAFRGTPNSS
jgi:hypothetical protein